MNPSTWKKKRQSTCILSGLKRLFTVGRQFHNELKPNFALKLFIVQGVCKMLEQTSGVSSPTQNGKKKSTKVYVQKQFSRKSPKIYWPQSFRFSSAGHLKTLPYSAPVEDENRLHFTNAFFCDSQTILKRPKPFKGTTLHDQTWPCASWFWAIRALNSKLS